MRFPIRFAFSVLLLGAIVAPAQDASRIPPQKLDMIKDAMASMRLDDRIQSMVDQQIDIKARRIANDNPDLTEDEVRVVRRTIAGVYAANMRGRGGLMDRVHVIFDRYFTEEDLRFAVRFRDSDGGRRYRDLAPRAVHDAMDAGMRWSEELEPEIRRRLLIANRDLRL